jgi:ABC-type multidrug transport system fused ATPase/permease subunit
MGLLDLAGVAIIGVLGALSVRGVQSQLPGDRVSQVLEFLKLIDKPFQQQAAILGCIATLMLIARTVMSILFTKRTLYFLSRRSSNISSNLISNLLNQSLLRIQEFPIQQIIFSVTHGVSAITLGVVGTTVALISDSSLLILMAAGLLVVDPLLATGTILIFSIIGFSLYKLLHKRARVLGELESRLAIQSNQKIFEVLSSYRESVVRDRRTYYAAEIGKLRLDLSNSLAELSFMPYIGKYVIETTVVIGALTISAVQFILQDAGHAVATLAVFLAAGSRIAPAVLRLQQGALSIKSSLGGAMPTLDLIEGLSYKDTTPINPEIKEITTDHSGFIPSVSINGISLTYPGKTNPAISNLSLEIQPGTSVALVGPSGAGKTSLVDTLLGVLNPAEGQIFISGLLPSLAISQWPGAISYVPQDVVIINGTVRENVTMGYPDISVADELVWSALDVAHLREFVEGLPQGLQTQVGDRGTNLSGGQRQRLGIARAMVSKPKLIVLDEATSALDGQTEADISETLLNLPEEVTVVMIAHRLSSVRNSDQVVYMDAGKIVAIGKFESVRAQVVDFDRQAQLMGL